MNSNNPLEVLLQVLPRARSDEDLVNMAAELAPPPPADFQPSGQPNPAQGGVARLQQPPAGVGGQINPAVTSLPKLVPPMSQGEARTSPRAGELLMGMV